MGHLFNMNRNKEIDFDGVTDDIKNLISKMLLFEPNERIDYLGIIGYIKMERQKT